MPYKVEIAPQAAKEIEEIYLYIAQDSLGAAMRWYFAIHDKIQTLKESPNRCPMAFESRFYSYAIRNLISGSYRVLFRVREQEQTVQILHVKHGARERTPI